MYFMIHLSYQLADAFNSFFKCRIQLAVSWRSEADTGWGLNAAFCPIFLTLS